jgi:hypothetical protein
LQANGPSPVFAGLDRGLPVPYTPGMTNHSESRTAMKTIFGRERALLDGLSQTLQGLIGGPPPSRRTLDAARRHNSGKIWPTDRGDAFEVQIVGPDGEPTGHIARVTVELDRFELPS